MLQMSDKVQFSSVQSLSRVRLFVTPWIAACQPSLSITNSRSSLRLTPIESVMPSNLFFFVCVLFIFIYLFIYFYFTILYWFCHILTWIRHGCTWVPNPEPPSHYPPHIISLGHPSAPAPSILYLVPNLDLRFVSYMIVYMFQCHSPKSSHLLPLPQSPKVNLFLK